MSVEIGLNATRTTTSSPLVTPPSRPPARFRGRPKPSPRRSIGSWTALPRSPAASKASANSAPFADGIEQSACAIRPSRRRSHCAYEPSPATTPVARTTETPPSVSPASFAAAIAAIIRALAFGSLQRTSLASIASRSNVGTLSTSPMRIVSLRTSIPTARRSAFAMPPAAVRAAVSRALARSRTSRTSSWSYLRAPARSA